MNVLITGITGSFGRNFARYLRQTDPTINVVGTAHSETKLAYFKKLFPEVHVYLLELSSPDLESALDTIMSKHRFDYVVHSAAMKHVDICQENPIMALRVNTIGSQVIFNQCKKHGVKNLIAMSTDKSNNPCNTYGFTKYIMQDLVLNGGYSAYQGANFFWSDGSVLDIWYNQYMKKQPLTIRDPDHVRYFNTLEQVCEVIYQNLGSNGQIILPPLVYRVRLLDLLEAFQAYFQYEQLRSIPKYDFEKQIEILRDEIGQIITLDRDQLVKLIDEHFQRHMI